MGSGLAVMSKEAEHCTYVSIKADQDILWLVKAAAALDKKDQQDWVSDILNKAAADRTGEKPIKRKPSPKKK